MPASSQPFAPSLHSESPTATASTEQHEQGAPIDPSLGANNQSNLPEMQNTVAPRPQGSEPAYKSEISLPTCFIRPIADEVWTKIES